MRLFTFFGIPAAVSLALLVVSPADAGESWFPKVGYSADLKMDMGKDPFGNSMILKGKIYASPDGNERREVVSQGQNTVIIKRSKDHVTLTLIPDKKIYWESRGGDRKKDPERMMREGDAKITPLGWETVNGIRTKKLQIEVMHKDGTRFIGHRWVTQQNVPVRMEGTSKGRHFRIDYTNIKTGKQDRKLFEIPANYQLVGSPGMRGWPPMGVKPRGEMPQGPPPGMTKEQWEQMKKMMEQMQRQQGGKY